MTAGRRGCALKAARVMAAGVRDDPPGHGSVSFILYRSPQERGCHLPHPGIAWREPEPPSLRAAPPWAFWPFCLRGPGPPGVSGF